MQEDHLIDVTCTHAVWELYTHTCKSIQLTEQETRHTHAVGELYTHTCKSIRLGCTF